MVPAEGDAQLLGIKRPAQGLEQDGFLAQRVGDRLCAVVVVTRAPRPQ